VTKSGSNNRLSQTPDDIVNCGAFSILRNLDRILGLFDHEYALRIVIVLAVLKFILSSVRLCSLLRETAVSARLLLQPNLRSRTLGPLSRSEA